MTRGFSMSYSALFLFSFASLSSGIKMPFRIRATGSPHNAHARLLASISNHLGSINVASGASSNDTEIGNINNIRYTTTVIVNGKRIPVALDTGSTDLWIMSQNGLGQFQNTGIGLDLKYGDGSYGVQGTIGIAPFEFGPYTVEKQAFLYANKSTISGLTDIGLDGLFGLGINTRGASPIKTKLASIQGEDPSRGASVLENIFKQHPSQPNFIGFDLVRTEDMEGSKDGSFTIGEYDEAYTAIQHAPKLSQFPLKSNRWTILLNSISVNGKSVPLSSSIPKTPKGKTVTLLDTGAPNTILPVQMLDAIYSQYSGAVKFAQEGQEVTWIVPCNATELVEFNFSGVKVPIHPLDMSVVYRNVTVLGQNYTFCMSSYSGIDGYSKDFDIMLGDDFLRNVYSVYDFGDDLPGGKTGEPYMQLMAKTDIGEATDQFVSIRSRLLSRIDEVAPADILNLLVRQIQLGGGHVGPTDNEENHKAKTYVLVIVGLLSANLFIGVILILLGFANYIRHGKPRPVASTYIPVNVPVDGLVFTEFQYDPHRP